MVYTHIFSGDTNVTPTTFFCFHLYGIKTFLQKFSALALHKISYGCERMCSKNCIQTYAWVS